MSKRLKSFFITVGAFVITAITAVITGPLWPSFVEWINTTTNSTLLGYGIPAIVAAIAVSFVGELLRQVANAIIASKQGYSSVVGASRNGADTF